MNQITLDATLQAGPAQVTDTDFPAGSTTIPFQTNPSPKGYAVDTGKNLAIVNSPGSYGALGAIGSGGPVTQATTLYMRSSVKMLLEITFGGADAGTVTGIPMNGVFFLEPDPGSYITAVAVKGSGMLEYYAAGQQ